jgi:hypothetical protein
MTEVSIHLPTDREVNIHLPNVKVSVLLVSCTFTNMLYIIVQPSTQNVMQNVFKKCCIQELLVFVNATVTGEHAWV